MNVSTTRNGDIEIAYRTSGHGERPLLLIQGGSAPIEAWPDGFCAELARRGFHLALFDNRDSGRSARARSPYTLADMAADACSVLDALDWPAAHVVGVSLGGMIAQVMAVHQQSRVLSLTSLSSAPNPSLWWNRHTPKVVAGMVAVGLRGGTGPQAEAERLVAMMRIIGSTGYPHDEDWLREMAVRTYEYRTDPAAARRQRAASRASGDRRAELSRIQVPSLVLTGEADPVQPVRAGRATAAAIPGARFISYPGMGHDLPRELWTTIADEIDAVATQHGT
ncbi:alpha/beta fold hydrolase [Nocardia brasiliensis]|uniref:alpha/beta fold hydrolase n=1 Tax=Nocardia brasiliensis TaxID=37326 RepID=UPI0024583BCE|nr:alpha/beta hydrolase [Nocardia brasiliensis]